MSLRFLSVACAAIALASTAHAEQFQAGAGVFNGSGYAASYLGAGGNTTLTNQALGEVVDGGNGAFDAFGFYNAGVGSLGQTRQVELLSGNVFRFFDTFTNLSNASVTTTLNFFGNLGSDGDELLAPSGSGLIVTCENSGIGTCANDPVLALVSGNNGLGTATLTPDRYNVRFTVTLLPGQSRSLLNFAFLASDLNGVSPADVALAQTTGQALLSAPRLDGLTAVQIAGIANYAVYSESCSARTTFPTVPLSVPTSPRTDPYARALRQPGLGRRGRMSPSDGST